MLRIGLRTSGLHLSNSGISINIKKGGCLIFKGPGYMGNNSAIEIQQNGNIIFGKNFGITSTFKIASRKSITIGDNFSSSWEVNIFDTDFHALYDTNNDIFIDQDDNVYIGNDVWLCQRVTILKGSFIPTRSIIASNSLVNRSFEGMPLNSLYAGLPAKLIKSGLTRKEFRLFEISEMKNIIEYLEL
jgi:Acetyltransferase (isoleucine patch superfamily)